MSKVDFYYDATGNGNGSGSTLVGTATTSPYSITWSNPAAGRYSITAKATDNRNAVTFSTPVSITVSSAAVNLYYVQPDQLGTPRLITNASNQVVWRALPITEPFGNSPPETNPSGLGTFTFNLAHSGYYRDNETQTFYAAHRDAYNPAIGGFHQSDRIGLNGGSYSTYSYAKSNPLSYTDPSGDCPWCLVAGFVVGAGANVIGTLIAGETPSIGDATVAGLGGVVAVVGAGEIVAGTVIGGLARVGAGIIGDLGFQLGFNAVSVAGIIPSAHGETLPAKTNSSGTNTEEPPSCH